MSHGHTTTPFITGDLVLQDRCALAHAGLQRFRSLLVTGEVGTGRTTLVRHTHEVVFGPETPLVYTQPDQNGDLADIPLDSRGTVCITGCERLNRPSQRTLTEALNSRETRAALVLVFDATLAPALQRNAVLPALYFNLAHCEVSIPPLRERRRDIPMLTEHFLGQLTLSRGVRPPRVDIGFYRPLEDYPFPGNVLELMSLIRKALLLNSEDRLTESLAHQTLDHHLAFPWAENLLPNPEATSIMWPPHLPTMTEVRTALLDEALRRHQGNQAKAAREVGLTAGAVNKYVNRHQ